ncbi:hypothetical protein KBC04_03340 [Candidatus Babeliales bacterium]|nr:hypothetical protein [Candidatus Babeliales bacterium]MBP9843914.1 hypothetical protein [Candidatus Babeliales bacterium]
MKKLDFLFLFILSWVSILSADEGFLENTLILTPSGYQKIQDLYVGDIVYDQDLQEKNNNEQL